MCLHCNGDSGLQVRGLYGSALCATITPCPPTPRALLERRGEGGEGVQAPPPCRNEPYPPGIAKMHHTNPFSIYICPNV